MTDNARPVKAEIGAQAGRHATVALDEAGIATSQLWEYQPGVVAVRLRPRVAGGQRQRTIHLIPIPETDVVPSELRTYCNLPIRSGEAELVRVFAGMPCIACVITAPDPANPDAQASR